MDTILGLVGSPAEAQVFLPGTQPGDLQNWSLLPPTFCQTCHGQVDQMALAYKENSLNMEWCLDCHRAPERHLRPVEYVVADVGGNLAAPIYGMLQVEAKLEELGCETPDGVYLCDQIYYTGPPPDDSKSSIEWAGEWTVTYETFRDMGAAFVVVEHADRGDIGDGMESPFGFGEGNHHFTPLHDLVPEGPERGRHGARFAVVTGEVERRLGVTAGQFGQGQGLERS